MVEEEDPIDYGPTQGDEYNFVCGSTEENQVYKLTEPITLCLFFDDKKNPPQKVLYNVNIDKFEDLQVKGLYDNFKENTDGNIEVTAMANGIRSRPVIMKMDESMAIILNLIVVLDKGKIDSL